MSESGRFQTPLLLVPAKRFEPLIARDQIVVSGKPVLTADQLVPLLVERKTPSPQVPANNLVVDAVKELTYDDMVGNPALTSVQPVPLSVDR